MRIIKAKDYDDLSRKAANIISAQVLLKPDCVLGLATGSTPIGTYKQLIEWYEKGDLDFSAAKSVNLDEYRGLTKDNDQSYYYFMYNDDVPKQAYTMGIGTIMKARKILLVVSGADKAQILHDVLCGPVTPEVPASILQLHSDVIVVADEAAMAKL